MSFFKRVYEMGADAASESSTPAAPSNDFPLVKKGYHRGEVDNYLRELAAFLEHGDHVDVGEVRNKMFSVVKRGYDRPEVHRYLGAVAEQVESSRVG